MQKQTNGKTCKQTKMQNDMLKTYNQTHAIMKTKQQKEIQTQIKDTKQKLKKKKLKICKNKLKHYLSYLKCKLLNKNYFLYKFFSNYFNY